MDTLLFPLKLTFKVTSLANDFLVTDAQGKLIFYVRQKLFKLIDAIEVFSDETRTTKVFGIKANKWLDFNTTYTFTNSTGVETGRVSRKGWASLWNAHYEIYDESQKQDLLIREENPWVKVADALFGEIPILNLFTGYIFNPAYLVSRPDGVLVAKLTKEPSLIGRKFTLEKMAEFESGEQNRIVLSLMMMILLERRRG